jgi:hypothetical protein
MWTLFPCIPCGDKLRRYSGYRNYAGTGQVDEELLQRNHRLLRRGRGGSKGDGARALTILKAAGVEAKVAVLPDGQDPDDFVRKNGAGAFLELERVSGVQYLLVGKKAAAIFPQEGREAYAIAEAQCSSRVTTVFCWRAISGSLWWIPVTQGM